MQSRSRGRQARSAERERAASPLGARRCCQLGAVCRRIHRVLACSAKFWETLRVDCRTAVERLLSVPPEEGRRLMCSLLVFLFIRARVTSRVVLREGWLLNERPLVRGAVQAGPEPAAPLLPAAAAVQLGSESHAHAYPARWPCRTAGGSAQAPGFA